ncbi:hypothetical protein [Bradyrhizobium sp. AZCC 2289]|uniref:hypothetical protein n=1 Tax=Bradyrhizobium sp. AZCC 2289 TaxID=3117026 RepID=UPI002FF38204
MLRSGQQVSELQQYMGQIYGAANSEFSVEAILARLLEAVSEATSPFDLADSHATFVKALSWYFAFCNRIPIDVQTCTIKRYPKLCPLCLSETCVCERTSRLPARASYLAGNREDTLEERASRILQGNKLSRKKAVSFDLNWFSGTLSEIYPVNRARWRVNRFYFPAKVLRETGKLANGFRKWRNAGSSEIAEQATRLLEKDAADFFAWLIGYWSLVASEIRDDDLQSKFVERYESGCPYCHEVPCGCDRKKRLGNRAEFVSFNLINQSPDLAEELERRLEEIRKSLEPNAELLKEFEPELKSKLSVVEAKRTLWKIAERVEQLDKMSGNGENIARRISTAIEWIDRTFSFFQG